MSTVAFSALKFMTYPHNYVLYYYFSCFHHIFSVASADQDLHMHRPYLSALVLFPLPANPEIPC